MEKIIEVTTVAKAVSAVIFGNRTEGLLIGNSLFNKELDRLKSLVEPVVIPEKAGDPGRLKVNHGCEARGIWEIFGSPMRRQHSRQIPDESQIQQGLSGAETILF